ncbi:MAG: hypothetical protein GX443_05460 [Deltaproteobacteria bacterium]|nr:hypothetical protein [Deltaproteobacteria bacterium]
MKPMRFARRLDRVFVFAALALTFSIPAAALGFSNEPVDFRGIQWGARIGELRGMQFLAEEGDLKFYERENDPMLLENVRLDRIVYGFYKDQFFTAMVYYASLADFLNLKDILSRNHGEPFRPEETPNRYFWSGEQIDILLIFNENTLSGRVSYFFKPLQKQAEGRQ